MTLSEFRDQLAAHPDAILRFLLPDGTAVPSHAHVTEVARVDKHFVDCGGTRREVVFNGSGLEVLWRTIIFVLLCFLIIPIPWMLRWYGQWYVSQFALAPRGAASA